MHVVAPLSLITAPKNGHDPIYLDKISLKAPVHMFLSLVMAYATYKIMYLLLLDRYNICGIPGVLLESTLILYHHHLALLQSNKLIPKPIPEAPRDKPGPEGLFKFYPSYM